MIIIFVHPLIDIRKLLSNAACIGCRYYICFTKMVNWHFILLLMENKYLFIFCFYFMCVPLFILLQPDVGSEVVDGLMQVLWGILDIEQPDTQTMNNIVVSSVELIYCYAECLALHGRDTGGRSVAPAVVLFKKLLFSPNEAVQTSSR